jgi:hypothetical protein
VGGLAGVLVEGFRRAGDRRPPTWRTGQLLIGGAEIASVALTGTPGEAN